MSSSYAAVTLDDINNTRKNNEENAFYQAKNDHNLIFNYYKDDPNFWVKLNEEHAMGGLRYHMDNYFTDDLFRYYVSKTGDSFSTKSQWTRDIAFFVDLFMIGADSVLIKKNENRSWYEPEITEYEDMECNEKFGCIKCVIYKEGKVRKSVILPVD